jgi:hypothetical protein
VRQSAGMDHWYGFETAERRISQVYETTLADVGSDLSAHVVTVPARSLGGGSYLFRVPGGLLGALRLVRISDVPLGGVVHSLAACLVSRDVAEFLRKFDEGFEAESKYSGTMLPTHFVFAEYLTFARVIPFEWSPLSVDSLGNILTAQGKGQAGYAYYEGTETPLLVVAIPAGMVICGSAPGVAKVLEAGLRRKLVNLVKSRSGERNAGANRS